MRPREGWILDVVFVVAPQLEPVEDLGEEEDPVRRAEVDGIEDGVDFRLDLLVLLGASRLEVSGVE